MTRRTHYHVHSHLGGGYLCECDYHAPLSAAERDTVLRAERDAWRDYAADVPSVRITGSVRSGAYVIDDTASIAWVRYVEAWSCDLPECSTDAEEWNA